MAPEDTVFSILRRKGTGIWEVAPETPVFDALQLMADQDIGAVLVTSGIDLVGIFSERDYARKVILADKGSRYTRVSDVMSSPPIVAASHQSAEYCLRLMNRFRIRHLPIVEFGTVIGVISIGDLVNWYIGRQREEIAHLHRSIADAETSLVTSSSPR